MVSGHRCLPAGDQPLGCAEPVTTARRRPCSCFLDERDQRGQLTAERCARVGWVDTGQERQRLRDDSSVAGTRDQPYVGRPSDPRASRGRQSTVPASPLPATRSRNSWPTLAAVHPECAAVTIRSAKAGAHCGMRVGSRSTSIAAATLATVSIVASRSLVSAGRADPVTCASRVCS